MPYLNSIDERTYTIIIVLLCVNTVVSFGCMVRKGFDYSKQKFQYHDLFGMAIVDFMLSSILVGVNGYGLTIEEYKWIGCTTSIVCKNLSAYSWYTLAELATASVIAVCSFYAMVYVRCNKSMYLDNFSKEVDSV